MNFFLSLFFPPKCPYCSKVIFRNETECPDCRIQFPSDAKIKKLPSEDICIAPFAYDSQVRKAILDFKYHSVVFNAESFSKAIFNSVRSQAGESDIDIITYVPMSKRSRKKRGYNQAEILAVKLAGISSKPCLQLLDKTKKNRIQHELNAEDRAKNVIGVYSPTDSEMIRDKSILIVDDICTTGSTLSECCRVLRQSGAKKVLCAAIAIADA